ncbi:MAG TPA: hypothetical protein VI702_00375 [Nitrospiria bacterium]
MRIKGEQGLGIFDTLIVLILISILIVVVIPKYQRVAREAQATALHMGLYNMRMAVGVYQIVNHRYPEELRDLANQKFVIPTMGNAIFTQEYLRSLAVDSEGYPVDPFKNRYRYNRLNGHVASTTKGYESW